MRRIHQRHESHPKFVWSIIQVTYTDLTVTLWSSRYFELGSYGGRGDHLLLRLSRNCNRVMTGITRTETMLLTEGIALLCYSFGRDFRPSGTNQKLARSLKRQQISVKTGIGQRATTKIIIPYPWGPIYISRPPLQCAFLCVVPGTH